MIVSVKANVDGLQLQKSVLVHICPLKIFLLLTKCSLLSTFRSQATTQNVHTNNDKCNMWGLEATAIPRCVKVQHIKGIANVFADSVSRLRAVGCYHDPDFKDHQQEFSIPFESLPQVEPATHAKL